MGAVGERAIGWERKRERIKKERLGKPKRNLPCPGVPANERMNGAWGMGHGEWRMEKWRITGEHSVSQRTILQGDYGLIYQGCS